MPRREIDKQRLVKAILAEVSEQLRVATQAQEHTQRGATHEESKPENDKDTRAIESSYLARGQALRVVELAESVATLSALQLRPFVQNEPAAVSALVEVDDGEHLHLYLICPAAGGHKTVFEGNEVSVLTPKSPLGKALLGQAEGDDVEVRTPQGTRELTIVSVR